MLSKPHMLQKCNCNVTRHASPVVGWREIEPTLRPQADMQPDNKWKHDLDACWVFHIFLYLRL